MLMPARPAWERGITPGRSRQRVGENVPIIPQARCRATLAHDVHRHRRPPAGSPRARRRNRPRIQLRPRRRRRGRGGRSPGGRGGVAHAAAAWPSRWGPTAACPPTPSPPRFAALHEFMAVAHGAGAQRIRAVATAALRDARNADAILAPARDRLGLTIDVIDAQAEAERSFVGAIYGLPVEHGLLVDIGGGSMEVVHFRDRAVEATWSFPFGVLRMWDRFLADDPPGEAELRTARGARARRPAPAPACPRSRVRRRAGGDGRQRAQPRQDGPPRPALPDPSLARIRDHRRPPAVAAGLVRRDGPSTSAACCRG